MAQFIYLKLLLKCEKTKYVIEGKVTEIDFSFFSYFVDVLDEIENEFHIFIWYSYMRRSVSDTLNILPSVDQHGRIQARI